MNPINIKPHSDFDLVLERVIDVPAELVWEAWTTARALQRMVLPQALGRVGLPFGRAARRRILCGHAFARRSRVSKRGLLFRSHSQLPLGLDQRLNGRLPPRRTTRIGCGHVVYGVDRTVSTRPGYALCRHGHPQKQGRLQNACRHGFL